MAGFKGTQASTRVVAASTRPQEVLDAGNCMLQKNRLQGNLLQEAATSVGFGTIVVSHAATGARAKRILAADVLSLRESVGRIEAAGRNHYRAVEASLGILKSIHLDHTTHLPAIFRRNARREDAQRLHVVRLKRGSEARGPIVRQGRPSTTNWV